MADNPLEGLVALFAVGTLPAGILAGVLVGDEAAAVVFVVGWLLLVPVTAVIGEEFLGDESAEGEDPLETLRERYARGEIDDVEFERRVEALVETEDVEVDPDDDRDHERERERERA